MEKEFSTLCMPAIICPHCGYDYDDSENFVEMNAAIIDCAECGEPFKLEVDITVDYTTKKIKG